MRRYLLVAVGLALVAGACAVPAAHEIDCPQVAVGEQIIVTGAPSSTASPWGFILDTVRWTAGPGLAVTDWRLGGDLDSDALEAVVVGEEAGASSLTVEYAQLNREGAGAVRTVTETCQFSVVEPPTYDLTGEWRLERSLDDELVCAGGPNEDDVEITIIADASGNLTVEGANTGYEPWQGAIDQADVAFGGRRDEPADLGGGTTEATFTLNATSRFRMNGTEAWTWTDGTTSCDATSEISLRKS